MVGRFHFYPRSFSPHGNPERVTSRSMEAKGKTVFLQRQDRPDKPNKPDEPHEPNKPDKPINLLSPPSFDKMILKGYNFQSENFHTIELPFPRTIP